MSKLKKVLLMCTAYVLVAALAIGGTIAYLQDTDSDVNVMTLGNVSIEQIEQERDANGNLVPFTQAKPLYPAVYEGDQLYMVPADQQPVSSVKDWEVTPINENVIDKIVTVKNTGKSEAYVRTIIAFETDNATDNTAWNKMHQIVNRNRETVAQSVLEYVEIDGVGYVILMYTYKAALAPGETSMPSLKQVYMNKEVTNEDCEAVDGNKNGVYDILVISQAIQTEGFDNAATALNTGFGELNAENVAKWFGDMAMPSVLASGTAIHQSTNKSGTFVLADDIKTSDYGSDSRYGWGYEYIVRAGADYTLDLNGKTLVHDTVNENANHNAFTYTFVANNAGTKLTINGDGKVYANNSEGYTCAIQGKSDTLITVNGGDYEVDNGIAVWAGAGSHIVINGGSFVNGNNAIDHELIYSSGGVIDIYGGFFHNTDHNDMTLNIEDRNKATGFINIYGGTFVNYDPSSDTRRDPDNIKVADGYKVVSETQANGDVWYTVVAE